MAAYFLLYTFSVKLIASNQTATLSPIVVDGGLAYNIRLRPYDFPADRLPTLQSFAKAQYEGKWIFIAGRTHGLHDTKKSGLESFPPAHQNREVWVIDPVSRESWHRSLDDPGAGLTASQIDSLSSTNPQFYQHDAQLYVSGGYGLATEGGFRTFDTLSVIDLPGILEWVQGTENATAAEHIRQVHHDLFRVTGGAMYRVDDKTHLVFGQDFQGGYHPQKNGNYTMQVRSFTINETEDELHIEDITLSEPQPEFRRRDLNVMPVVQRGDEGELEEKLVALSGVFTPTNGAWTIPVEIDPEGGPSMPDPSQPDTFRQGMNGYHSAKVGMYSESTDEMHLVLFGGISFQYYDRASGQFISDDQLPFINQNTAIVIDSQGRYTQHLLADEFPLIYDDTGRRLHFGAGAEFMLADDVPVLDSHTIRLDELRGEQTIGYIVGGIVADQGNGGNSAASNLIFEVVYQPVPEPRSLDLILLVTAIILVVWFLSLRRKRVA
jgi:hypothetical protein